MKEEPDLFEALQAFDAMSQAAVFTSSDCALLFALIRTWNSARRPAVIEQWADTTSRNAGMTNKMLRDSRNRLIQKKVIFYEKDGNRGVPRYSLNALLGLDNPFLLSLRASNGEGIRASKRSVTGQVNGHSYQGKEKVKVKKKNTPLTPLAGGKASGKPTPSLPHGPLFAEAWANWRKHRSEIRKPLKPTMEAAQLAELGKLSESHAVARINHTIAMGWQGLRDPDKLPPSSDMREHLGDRDMTVTRPKPMTADEIEAHIQQEKANATF